MEATALLDVSRCALTNGTCSPVDVYTPVIKCFTFVSNSVVINLLVYGPRMILNIYPINLQCLYFGLTYANIKCGTKSSGGVLYLFSFLLVICGAPQFYKLLKSNHYLSGLTLDVCDSS